MARSIDFDYDVALDRATWLFWRDGYAGTSLRDLLKAMGIGEGSFYNTLKSKKRLYVECLKRYQLTEGKKRFLALTSSPTTGAGLRAFFGVLLDCIENPQSPSPLCMLAGMVTGDVLADPDLRQIAEEGLTAFERRLIEGLTKDQAAGVIAPSLEPQATAGIIITYLQGLWRMALLSFDRGQFERQIEMFLCGLGL